MGQVKEIERMASIVYQRFCCLCGQTKSLNQSGYRPKKLMLIVGNEQDDMGYVCDKCLKFLENGGVFNKPRK